MMFCCFWLLPLIDKAKLIQHVFSCNKENCIGVNNHTFVVFVVLFCRILNSLFKRTGYGCCNVDQVSEQAKVQ